MRPYTVEGLKESEQGHTAELLQEDKGAISSFHTPKSRYFLSVLRKKVEKDLLSFMHAGFYFVSLESMEEKL